MTEVYWMDCLPLLIPLYVDLALRRVYRPLFAWCLTRRNYVLLFNGALYNLYFREPLGLL